MKKMRAVFQFSHLPSDSESYFIFGLVTVGHAFTSLSKRTQNKFCRSKINALHMLLFGAKFTAYKPAL